jgi:predicted molibdopterin-dependent oxidoreductase YjgC
VEEVTAAAEKAAGFVRPDEGLLLLGEKKAIGLRGFYDPEETLSVSPGDAVGLGLDERDVVTVKSSSSEAEFSVHVTDAVPTGVAAVGVNAHRNRALFPLAEDEVNGVTTVPPARATVAKTGRKTRQGGENPSVWSEPARPRPAGQGSA